MLLILPATRRHFWAEGFPLIFRAGELVLVGVISTAMQTILLALALVCREM